ncbi:MAG: bifunctional protein-serine/threonine kinase/phosphatase [Betaproteobacteria bacterium]|nr:bifunctional protein-serine/threonine kinase/phosphatase [Betaproteobacteria bacterium]
MNAPVTPALDGFTSVSMGCASSMGSRSRNEDFMGATLPAGEMLAQKGNLFAVADGVGGHAKGREAAEFAVRSLLCDYYSTPDTLGVAKSLHKVLDATNRWLFSQARRTPESAGMAATLTALVLRDNRFHLVHVGDSRAYLLRGGDFIQLTEDHTWPHPEFSNVLARAMGLDENLRLDHLEGEIQPGDRFLLCTDGLWNEVPDSRLKTLLAQHGDPQDAADDLLRAAGHPKSADNCTCTVIHVHDVKQAGFSGALDMGRDLVVPPRLKPGEMIDGMTVQSVLHVSRSTLLYRVQRRTAQGEESLVLKTLKPEAADEESVSALIHEEWLARRVVSRTFPTVQSHPLRSRLYYLMSWHEGETLASRLRRGHRFHPEEVAHIGTRLLRSIAELHRLGILHRDIKPDNLLWDTSGQLVVLDLGVAASERDHLNEINNPGTPSYMAPELFTGTPCSESSDLYACGVTLYELLTRKFPYGEIEPFQHPRFREPVPPSRYRPDIPSWLENLLLKACALNPASRFETAEEFLLALERGANRPLVRPRRAPLVEQHPAFFMKALASLSLLGNLAALYFLSRH